MPKLVGIKVELRFESDELSPTNSVIDDLHATKDGAAEALRLLQLDEPRVCLIGCTRDMQDQNAVVLTYLIGKV